MKRIFLFVIFVMALRPEAQSQFFSLDNPLIKSGMKLFVEKWLPEITKMESPVGELKVWKIKHGKGFYRIRGVILPDNKATNWLTGKGDCRFRLKVADTFLPPKFYWLGIHIPRLRILGIRFYYRVFTNKKARRG